jgi:coenzyme F420-0:L-glutamate ligase/coenzyme F420-1:gamma-L-glutamate ligase
MEDLMAALRRRRSVRHFFSRPVSSETVVDLLEAACLAPSAHNRQPWRYAVVLDRDGRRRLADAMADRLRKDRLADGAPAEAVEADVARSRTRLLEAACAIVVCLTMESMDAYPDRARSRAELRMAIQSVAMAGENLLLAAAAAGLGACWMCAPLFAGQEARQALDLPESWEPQGMILLGEAGEDPAPKPRLPVDEVTLWR